MSTNNFNSVRFLPNHDAVTLNRKVASRGEVFYDPDTISLRIYDGFVSGGHQILRADLSNLTTTIPTSAFGAGSISNSKLANSSITIGSSSVSLGGTLSDLTGLTSVSATTLTGTLTGNVTGNLTGNVTGGTSGTHTGPVIGDVSGNVTGNVTGSLTGNASTATKLATARTINGTYFDGTADVIVSADAQLLTGTYIASQVVDSSLTTVGTLVTLSVAGATTIGGSIAVNTDATIANNVSVGGRITAPSKPTTKNHLTNKNYVDKRAAAMAVALS